MTEEEAKTKWCPFSNATQPCATVSGNRDAQLGEAEHMHPNMIAATRCISSSCMAWRWNRCNDGAVSVEYGYCGLAGKP